MSDSLWSSRMDANRGIIYTRDNGRGDTIEVCSASLNGPPGRFWRITGRIGGPDGLPVSQTGPYSSAEDAMFAADLRLRVG